MFENIKCGLRQVKTKEAKISELKNKVCPEKRVDSRKNKSSVEILEFSKM